MGMKAKKRRPPALRPGGVDRLDNAALRETLLDKLTVDELKVCRNELCLQCGEYKRRHKGACDGCRWEREVGTE